MLLNIIATSAIMCCVFSFSGVNRLSMMVPAGKYLINGQDEIEISYTDESMMIRCGTTVEIEGKFHLFPRCGGVDVMVFDPHPLGDLSTIMSFRFTLDGRILSMHIGSTLIHSDGRSVPILNVGGEAQRLSN